jgi:spore maturation protein CgeB
MSFGGSAQAMVQSIKYNLGQIRSRKRNKIDSAKRVKTEYNFGKPTEKELEIIKQNIRSRAKIERLRVLILTLITSIIIFTLLYLF